MESPTAPGIAALFTIHLRFPGMKVSKYPQAAMAGAAHRVLCEDNIQRIIQLLPRAVHKKFHEASSPSVWLGLVFPCLQVQQFCSYIATRCNADNFRHFTQRGFLPAAAVSSGTAGWGGSHILYLQGLHQRHAHTIPWFTRITRPPLCNPVSHSLLHKSKLCRACSLATTSPHALGQAAAA